MIHTHASLTMLSLSALLLACDDSPTDHGSTLEPGSLADCSAHALEQDLRFVAPLAGPGVDPTAGTLRPPEPGQSIMVGTTYLQLLPGAAAAERLGVLTQAVTAEFPKQPGFLGAQIASSQRCGTARTLSFWRDEEALIAFVASPGHLEAMRRRDEVSRGGWSAHYLATQASELTWERALQSLEPSY